MVKQKGSSGKPAESAGKQRLKEGEAHVWLLLSKAENRELRKAMIELEANTASKVARWALLKVVAEVLKNPRKLADDFSAWKAGQKAGDKD